MSTLFYYINTYGNDPQKQNSFIEIQSDIPNDLFSITKNINLIKTVYIKAEVTEALYKNGNQLKFGSAFISNALLRFNQLQHQDQKMISFAK